MFIITICLLVGHPCQDQPRVGLFDSREQCELMIPAQMARIDKKYKAKAKDLVVTCREMWIHKLTQKD